jgi:hypothetical protein
MIMMMTSTAPTPIFFPSSNASFLLVPNARGEKIGRHVVQKTPPRPSFCTILLDEVHRWMLQRHTVVSARPIR